VQTGICNGLAHSSDFKALAALRCEHLGQHFLKPGKFGDISVSRIPHFVQSVVLLNVWAKGLHRTSKTVQVHRPLQGCHFVYYSVLFYSALFYSILSYTAEECTCNGNEPSGSIVGGQVFTSWTTVSSFAPSSLLHRNECPDPISEWSVWWCGFIFPLGTVPQDRDRWQALVYAFITIWVP